MAQGNKKKTNKKNIERIMSRDIVFLIYWSNAIFSNVDDSQPI